MQHTTGCERHPDEVVAQRAVQITAHGPNCLAAEFHCPGQGAEVVGVQRDRGRAHCEVGSARQRHTHVRRGECRRIVNAVADEQRFRAVGLHGLHGSPFVIREQPGARRGKAERFGAPDRVPGQHLHRKPQPREVRERLRGGVAQALGDCCD